MFRLFVPALCVAVAAGHGAMVSPLSRNAIDHMVGVNTQRCSNITGDKCNNGQASFCESRGPASQSESLSKRDPGVLSFAYCWSYYLKLYAH